MKKLIVALLMVVLIIPFSYAKENVGEEALSFKKPQVIHDAKQIDINTVKAWVRNDGELFRHPTTGNSGFEWPKDGGVFAIYASGIWIGARVEGDIRVAVAEYSQEFNAGQIIGGFPDNPELDKYITYKLNKGDAVPQDVIDAGGPPEVLGDQMLWCVYNDADASYHVNMGTAPLKVEVQQTVLGYDRLGPLGNTVFVKWLIINKSGAELEDTYLTVWSDPDLGDSGDDFVGCDTTLSLGYVYNSSNVDGEYGSSPPAAGYDFLQGPVIPSPGDTALVSGQKIADYKNLPMTSFVYYNNTPDNNGNPQTGAEVYNYMRSFWRDGTPITEGGTGIDPANPPTKFMYTGDPEAGTGWIDSSPADRRFLMTTGPFTMQAFDDVNGNGKPDIGEPGVQEVVVGVAVARGLDNRNGVTVLKFFDTFVQQTYDANFEIPNPPVRSEVDVTLLSNEIVLNWDNDFNRQNIETYHEFNKGLQADPTIPEEEKFYDFEGYIVYQYDFLDMVNSKVVATFDVANGVGNIIDLEFDLSTGQFIPILRITAPDEGLARWIAVKEDKFAVGAETRLINGKRYWFGLAAYGYNEHSVPSVIESSPTLIEVVPQSPAVGTKFNSSISQMIESVKIGESDGGALGIVVDPSKVTGHDYKIEFFEDAEGGIFWQLNNVTLGTTALDSQYYQSSDSADTNYPIADGIQWKVLGPPPTIKEIVEVSWAGTPVDPPDGVWHSLNSTADYYISAGGGLGTIDRLERYATYAVPRDFEMRFTDGPNWAVQGFTTGKVMSVPFELWDIGISTPDDPSDDIRMIPYIYENVSDVFEFQMTGDTDPYFSFPASDWVYWMDPITPDAYESNFAPEAASVGAGGDHPNTDPNEHFWADRHGGFVYPIGRWIICDYADDQTPPPSGTTIRLVTNKINIPGIEYTLQSPSAATVGDMQLAKDDLELINVFPNPYYGTHSGERLPTERWVEFTHLPPNCTIRIFNLAGVLVRTLERENVTERTWEKWDLLNESELPVASGIYIYHIEVPDVGEKIGKLAVFISEERLDTF